MSSDTEMLFSYGTLQDELVQRRLFGRLLKGKEDVLTGFVLSKIEIRVTEEVGVMAFPIIMPSGNPSDIVQGVVFNVNTMDLVQADLYEGEEYNRIQVKLESGILAWVYVSPF